MQVWRLIDTGADTPEFNMALDEVLSLSCRERSAPPTLRFYQWALPSISIGYFQKAHEVLDLSRCKNKGIGIVRRLTGGGAVYHHHEITYSLSGASGTLLYGKNLKQTFFHIAHGFKNGFEKMGIPVTLWGEAPPNRLRSPLCFASSSWYEMTTHGKKIMGSAQRRWRNGFLQQGSILIKDDPEIVLPFFNFSSDKEKSKNLTIYNKNTMPLERFFNTIPPLDDLKNWIIKGFEEEFSIRFLKDAIQPYERTRVQKFIKERYGNERWTYREKKVYCPTR